VFKFLGTSVEIEVFFKDNAPEEIQKYCETRADPTGSINNQSNFDIFCHKVVGFNTGLI
jgi:hypothetical protein